MTAPGAGGAHHDGGTAADGTTGGDRGGGAGGTGGTGVGPRLPPDRLGWLYALVLASLISVGISAGGLYFLADRSLSRPWAAAVDVCTRAHPVAAAQQSAARDRCLAGQFRRRGVVMLAGAGIALGAAAALVLVLPLADRRRLRRRLTVPGAQERFVDLCDRNWLAARHRPRLVVAAPPARQAYTTGGVVGRSTVVLPAAVAVAHADTARFDPVVAHELAHVLARDVAWASAVRALVWLPVPAVLAAGLFEVVFFGLNATYLTALGRAAVVAVLTALLAAGLLRRREREADRYAADAGHAGHLAALLRAGTARPTRRRRLLARHPDPAIRAAALGRPADPPGGVTHGLAVGAVAMLAMSAADALVRDLFLTVQATVGPPVAVCVGSLLLSLGLLPTLVRRAAGAGGWWRPVLGAAVGFAVTAFLATALPVPGSSGVSARPDVSVALLVAAFAGPLAASVAGLCVLLARLVVARRPGSVGWRSATYLVAVAAGVAVLWPLPALASVPTDGHAARAWLVFALPRSGWPLLALLVPVLVGALLRGAGQGRRRPARRWDRGVVAVVLTAVLVGAGAAMWWTELFPPHTLAEANRLAQQRWLLCALTGWAVLVVLALGRRAGVGGALTAGWAAGTAAALLQYAHALATGRADGLDTAEAHLLAPLAWLGYLVAVTLPFLVSRPAVPGPTPSAPGSARAPVAAVGALAALLAVAVLGPGVPGAYAPLPVAAPTGAAAASTAPVAPPTPDATPGPTRSAPGRPDPGRLLTRAEARRAAGAVRAVLPPGWRVPLQRGDGGGSRIDPSACRPLAEDAYLDRLGGVERVRERARYATVPGLTATASAELVIEIRSHAEPVPASVLAEAESARRDCPRFTARGADGSAVGFAVDAQPPPALGEQSWRVDYRLSAGSGRTRITGRSAFVIVRAGHNLVTVYASAIMESLDERLLDAAVEAAVAGLTD
ncbi:M48 family metalloprotease [Micromonospora sp. NPDC023633]|uniref:M48 family metalloprotease n=1 Tax=Micromonospora sp. NPDC023633 TaxID=3154320 RepID=UPI0033FE57D9